MTVVRDKEAGNIIAIVDNYLDGIKLISEYEENDKADDTYTEDFYEVAEIKGLKDIRKARFFSQSELAEASGVNLRTLQDYEQGRKNINGASALTVYRLAEALGCTVGDLLEL